MAPLTRAQMKQLAEDALLNALWAVQEWVTAIPRDILKKLFPESLFSRRAAAKALVATTEVYIVRRFTTGSPIDGTHWLPNKEMTKLWEVSDETSTDRFPHFQCLTLQCDTSTLSLRSGGRVG